MEAAWEELPPDMTALILQKLSSVEILTSAQKVCREWRRVSLDPSMWRRVNMQMGKRQYFTTMEKLCQNAVDRSQGQLIDFSIQYFGTNSLLLYVAQRSKRLRRLKVCDTFISSEAIIEALEYFPVLEELHMCYSCLKPKVVEAIGRCCPLLKSLNLHKPYERRTLVKCNLDTRAIAENMPQLRHLQLFANNISDEGLQVILEGCPHLESLDLTYSYSVRFGQHLRRLCSQRKNLRLSFNNNMDYLIYRYGLLDDDHGRRRYDV